MKRPFACFGLGALAALATAAAYSGAAVYLAAACFSVSAVLLALRIFFKKERILAAAAALLSAAVAVCAYCGAVRLVKEPRLEQYAGERVTFSGTITDEPYTSGATTFFTVMTDEINGEPCKLKFQVAADTVPSGGAYDLIEGSAVFSAVRNDESGLGTQTSLEARGVFLQAYIGTASKTRYTVSRNEDPPVWKALSNARAAISETFKTYLPQPEAALCTAMVTGDKSGLPNDVSRRFKTLGVAHIIVVSGLHLSIAAAILGAFARRAFSSRYFSCAVQLAGVFAFAALTAFGWSACRALVMISVMILSQLANAKPDPLNTLGLAALLLCVNPFAAGDIGLLWSFCCTSSIIVLSKPISGALEKLSPSFFKADKLLPELISAAAAAFVGSLPFVIFVTKTISLYTVAVNILIVPVTGVVILCGGAAAALSACGLEALSALPMLISGAAAKYMLFITRVFYELPGASVRLGSSAYAVWLAASAGALAAVWLLWEKKEALRFAAALSAASFLFIIAAQVLAEAQSVTLYVADIGSGITAVLRYNGGSAVLASYGEPYQYAAVRETIENFGEPAVVIDIPQPGARYDYTRKILHDNDPELVIVHDEKTRLRSCAWYEYTGGQAAEAGEAYTLELPRGSTAELFSTETLCCEYLTLYGHTVLICGGDGELPEKYASPDIAIVQTDAQLPQLADNTRVIVSNYGVQYDDERIINATNGEGRLDITLSSFGVSIDKTYTGGVVRYADNNGE